MVNLTLFALVILVVPVLYGRVKAWDKQQERRGHAPW